ncbi:MAG: 2-oxoacid:acceptor oxidoreductase subunit alpha [Gaiellales bacterium]|nr:MAG: 2-oxoacid:acceptor oxidoreductase subunit alpha [Gaiellales bacterium]
MDYTIDYTIRIGGQAGQGLQTIGAVLAKLFARQGLHVFTHQDYMSRVRGGHNFYQLRFASRPVHSSRRGVDILLALDGDTVLMHQADLNPRGIVIYDSAAVRRSFDGPDFLDVPLRRISMDLTGVRLMENTAAVGAVMGILGLDLGPLERLLGETFEKKGREVVDQNIAVAREGAAFARDNCPECAFQVPETGGQPRILLDGSTGAGLGALVSGCRFYAAYPMTPSTGVLNFMASQSKSHGIVVEQAEDEIAAINMAIGASYAGVRSMTGTAGGGFALMVEGLSLAGMTETPVVIYVGQRPAPATGLPTRTEQADLLFVIHAAHGEFPRVVFAPGTPEQAFYLTNRAFDLADKYQVPAFILSDQYLVDSEWTLDGLDPGRLSQDSWRLGAAELEGLDSYRRHALTDTGVSPLAAPGLSRHLVVTDSDEHDEDGHLIEDAETRNLMVDKRLLKKLPLIREEIEPPLLYGDKQPELVIVGWGSTFGVMKDAVDELGSSESVAMLHFSQVFPFPTREHFDFIDLLQRAGRTVCVENNATSQFARLMRAETGYQCDDHVTRFDGRPFLLDELLEAIHG